MRTQKEIVERVKKIRDKDLFGFGTEVLVWFLDFDHAQEFLKEGAQPSAWEHEALNRETVLKKMREYMPFAWEKANDCRGISSNRSVMKMIEWVWLLGDDDFTAELERDYEGDYEYYGKPILRKICQKYGFKIEDDGRWRNDEFGDWIEAPPLEPVEP